MEYYISMVTFGGGTTRPDCLGKLVRWPDWPDFDSKYDRADGALPFCLISITSSSMASMAGKWDNSFLRGFSPRLARALFGANVCV